MRRDAPDTRFYQDVSGLNREFLALLTHPDAGPAELRQLGLPAGIAEALGCLSAHERECVADVPVLLADLGGLGEWAAPSEVAEPAEPLLAPRWVSAVQVFSAALLTYVSQLATRDRLATALCLGPVAMQSSLGGLDFAGIRQVAACGAVRLRARHGFHPRLWPDLLRAARGADQMRLKQCRLDWIPLGLAELRDAQAPSRQGWNARQHR